MEEQRDELYGSLRQLIADLGGYKRVGYLLWPLSPLRQSGTELRNKLKPNHRSKLDLEDLVSILGLAHEAGLHQPMELLARLAGYKKPEPFNTEEQRIQVERRLSDAIEEMNRLARRHLQQHNNGVSE